MNVYWYRYVASKLQAQLSEPEDIEGINTNEPVIEQIPEHCKGPNDVLKMVSIIERCLQNIAYLVEEIAMHVCDSLVGPATMNNQ